jgi:asparagine synthase (glutamine-hydrolysing)
MKLASENGVGVILDGQGSDEINIGYAHSFYRYYADLLNQKRGRTFVKEFSQYLTSKGSKSVPEKIVKTMLVYMFSESYRYKKEVKHNLPNLLLKDFKEDELIGEVNDLPVSKLSSFLYNLVMTIYLQTLLHYVDRNSMAFSIESRTPFLDHKLVEFLFSLPAEYKIKGGISKRIHRDAMQELVPEVVLNRKDKVNFASPAEAYWLKNEMGGFMQGILQSSSFKNRDLFNLKRIDKIYKEYLAGRRSHGFYLWKVISIEIWLRVFLDDYPV